MVRTLTFYTERQTPSVEGGRTCPVIQWLTVEGQWQEGFWGWEIKVGLQGSLWGACKIWGEAAYPLDRCLRSSSCWSRELQRIQLMAQGAGVNMGQNRHNPSPREVTGWRLEEEDRSPWVACTWQGRMASLGEVRRTWTAHSRDPPGRHVEPRRKWLQASVQEMNGLTGCRSVHVGLYRTSPRASILIPRGQRNTHSIS